MRAGNRVKNGEMFTNRRAQEIPPDEPPEVPPETLAYLQRHAPRDFGALCTLLDRLDSASLATHRRLTVPLAREVLEGS